MFEHILEESRYQRTLAALSIIDEPGTECNSHVTILTEQVLMIQKEVYG
jgi:hypothetical protein